ncbi:AP-3 complex subunit delta [Euphorbia peplus]|nr:AP-3 complex subunit delta [Euphorbia peplus]
MRRTGAKSLMFECIRTVVTSFGEYDSAVKLAVSKVREFLVDDDPNLKYLGLHALAILAEKHLCAVLENKEVVINSLSDVDPNVKLESLHLVIAMVSENNVVEIYKVLINYALKSDPEFCHEIIGSILSKCSENVYEIIVDFDWYVSLLGDLLRIPHCQKSEEIENQLVDIGMRVKDVRLELVRVCRELLIDPALLGNLFLHRILSAAAWVCGEYLEFLKSPIELVQALLQPRTSLLPPSIRTDYLQSAYTVLIFCLHSYLLQTERMVDNMKLGLTDLESEKDFRGSSSFAVVNASPSYEQDKGFNPRDSNNSDKDVSLAYGRSDHTSSSMEKNAFLNESIIIFLIMFCYFQLFFISFLYFSLEILI